MFSALILQVKFYDPLQYKNVENPVHQFTSLKSKTTGPNQTNTPCWGEKRKFQQVTFNSATLFFITGINITNSDSAMAGSRSAETMRNH